VFFCIFLRVEESGRALMTIARKVMAHNPKQSPSMLKVAAPLSDVDSVASERKSSRVKKQNFQAIP